MFLKANSKEEGKKTYSNPFINKKELSASKITEPIIIDGILNESAWENASIAKQFVTFSPTIGEPANKKTEVNVLYDNDALYIGAKLFDNKPDSIIKTLSQRDQEQEKINADIFWITLNPYNDGQNIFKFLITASNVQSDIKISSIREDIAWNAVWESDVKITNEGWLAEIKIPYAAIRFSNESVQTWSINFWREVKRTGEISSWNLVNRTYEDQGNQDGFLTSIDSVKSPFRLELYPYVSSSLLYGHEDNNRSLSAGMDLKYGLSESFTLDMTLIPDFGQKQSDDEILNLSAYEIRYKENRQFFTEGTELFNKAGLFYSRRIGDKPTNYEDVENNLTEGEEIRENPVETSLINATKISGRNKNGLGLGFFNAMTSNTYAKIIDSLGNERKYLTEPFSNYNILVVDQTLKNNSYINIINTNVYKPSIDYVANVTGTIFKLTDKKNIYGIEGKSAISNQLNDSTITGYMSDLKIGKFSGNLQYSYNLQLLTDTYDPNDLGYLRKNNIFKQEFGIGYKSFEPKGIILNWNCDFSTEYIRLYSPSNYSELSVRFYSQIFFNNYWSFSFYNHSSPIEHHDFNEPRVEGRVFKWPVFFYSHFNFSSDYRKTFSMHLNFGYLKNNNMGYSFSIIPKVRVNDKLSFNHEYSNRIRINQYGYVRNVSLDSIIFGMRDQKTITNTFSSVYIFNNKMSLNLRLRHYWSVIDYSNFYNLNFNGRLDDINYYENENINYNKFNIDLLYSWNFAPGSFLSFAWKNSISKEDEILNNNFINNLKNILKSPQNNIFSIKISYYLNYNNLVKRKS